MFIFLVRIKLFIITDGLFDYANTNDSICFIDLTKVGKNGRNVYDWEEYNTKNDIEIGISTDYYQDEIKSNKNTSL